MMPQGWAGFAFQFGASGALVAHGTTDVASSAKCNIGSHQTGWGTWIRTKTNRVRVCCATVTPFPKGLLSKFNSLKNCSAVAPQAANRANRPAAVLPARDSAWQGCN